MEEIILTSILKSGFYEFKKLTDDDFVSLLRVIKENNLKKIKFGDKYVCLRYLHVRSNLFNFIKEKLNNTHRTCTDDFIENLANCAMSNKYFSIKSFNCTVSLSSKIIKRDRYWFEIIIEISIYHEKEVYEYSCQF